MTGPEQIKQLKLWIQPKITTFIITNEYLLFIVHSQNENYTTETLSRIDQATREYKWEVNPTGLQQKGQRAFILWVVRNGINPLKFLISYP